VNVGLSDADVALLTQDGPLDVILNSAGLVSFNPSLESALRINVHGVRYVMDLARATGAKVVHVSTCFVAGRREGEVWEDEQLIGYFPRRPGHQRSESAGSALRKGDFDPEAEIADCERLIEQTRQRAEDRARLSMFRDQGADRLRAEGRDPEDERHLKAALQREKKTWTAERLTELGMERAQHWGFTNTYTYTKSLGDQLCALAALPESERKDGKKPVRVAIVRPAIVESAMSYPFPGWNEGFNTTAPMIFMVLKGHIQVPASHNTILDMIPVDMVSAATIAAVAATIAERNELIYHVGSSDSSPLRMPRSVELTGLYKRRHYRDKIEQGQGDAIMNRVRSRLESIPVSKARYQRLSVPLLRGVAEAASSAIGDALGKMWGMPRLTALGERARETLDAAAQLAKQGESIFDLFLPFVHDNAPIFRADNTRRLYRSLTPHDQTILRWNPETINWREYMLGVHIPGLEKWIFPSLDEEFQARAKAVYTYRDLLEMLESAAKAYRGRTAMRLLPPLDPDGEPVGYGQRYTYRDLSERSARVGETLRQLGMPVSGKVLLLAENRPEWAISYFGVLKAAGVVVPVDKDASLDEVLNICRWADVYAVIVSDKVQARIDVRGALSQAMPQVKVLSFGEVLGGETPHALIPASSLPTLTLTGRAEEMASLIFTSGTTGRPKGVMLSHRNFTSLLAKMGGVFDVDKHDGLLSVLPLHHTFEFSAGLLMPLSQGAQIAYLPEVSADSLQHAFSSAHITGMVGVPALYQLLYRRITKQISDRLPSRAVPWVLRLLERLYDLTRAARERTRKALGFELNLPRALFLPIHSRFGGKLRLLISGGSALPVETMKEYRGLGFNLYEGYGMTESSPVLTVTRPGTPLLLGSVGEPLPGIDVKIHEPDASGVGEIIASGPNVMLGYYNDPELTAETIKRGYLHTGDLGRTDSKGHLYIVGRKKDVIIGLNGENVYPDELEERYRESPFVKELCVVGLPEAELKDAPSADDKGETVACLIVPAYDAPQAEGLLREEVRDKVREHVRQVSGKLSVAKRVKILHLTDLELPKTATRKVKRKQVVEELRRLERTRRQAQAEAQVGGSTAPGDWLLSLLADVTGKPRSAVRPDSTLQELGLDSLSFAELGVALEAAGVSVPENLDISSLVSVPELQKAVAQWGRRKPSKDAQPVQSKKKKPETESTDDRLVLPRWLVRAGNHGLNVGQRALYERVLKTRVTGRAYLPAARQFIVAANHSSHLDMGLVKHALGDWGDRLVALAAKDYFFDDPLKRVYFENFTNLIPMDRTGSLRESLRLAARVIEDGYVLLIFPEGTRSENGVMQSFKASIGYLSLHHRIDVLPMYLEGTHDAMPKGNVLPKQGTKVAAHIGPVLSFESLQRAVAKVPRTEQNREAARLVELAVRKLAPIGPNRHMPTPSEDIGDGKSS
jgi:long-chain acyl-CoA synthetase